MADEEVRTVNETTEHFKNLLSSDSEEVSEQTDIIKEEKVQPEPEKVTEEVKEPEEQPQEEKTDEIIEEEVKEEEPEKPPVEADKGKVRKIKADGKWHEIAEADVDRRLSMAIHAEQKLEQYNKGLRDNEYLRQALEQERKKYSTPSKEIPAVKEELPPQLVKEEITEDDEYEGTANEKKEKNALKDYIFQQDKKIERLENMAYKQETDLYANDLERQFEDEEKFLESEMGIKLSSEKKSGQKWSQRDFVKSIILLIHDRGQRWLEDNPDFFRNQGRDLVYTMRDAFSELSGAQFHTLESPQSLTVEDIVKNEKLLNDVKEHLFTEEAKKEESAEPIIQKKGKPPLKDETDEIFENKKEGDTYTEAITKDLKRKYPNFRI